MSLLSESSAIVGVRIEPGHWKDAIDRLDRQGAFTRKHMMEFIIMLCIHLDELEKRYAAITNAAQQPTQTPVQPTTE